MEILIGKRTKYKCIIDDEDLCKIGNRKLYVLKSKLTESLYVLICVNGKNQFLHRFLVDADKDKVVDHKDRDTMNNSKSNLRVCTRSQNGANRKSSKNGSSKYLGVHFASDRKKWVAAITFNGVCRKLGHFHTEEEAAIAYNIKAKELHKEFANLNIIN